MNRMEGTYGHYLEFSKAIINLKCKKDDVQMFNDILNAHANAIKKSIEASKKSIWEKGGENGQHTAWLRQRGRRN